MSPKVWITLSLCLNVGLGLGYYFTTRPEMTRVSPTIAPKVSKVSSVRPKTPGTVTVTNVIRTDFKWSQLETADYKEYIKRLRAIGCPEETIQDIILADLDNVYEPKINKLKGINPVAPGESYWLVNRTVTPAARPTPETEKEIKELQEERTALVKELLGVSEKSVRSGFNWYEDAVQNRYSFVDAEQRDKLMALEKKYGRGTEWHNTSGDNRLSKEMREKMVAEMKEFLSPEQVFEYELRNSDEARMLRMNTRSIEMGENEYRSIFQHVYTAMEAQRSLSEEDRKNPEKRKEMAELSKSITESIKSTLGEERFEEMQRSLHPSYSSLVNAAPILGYDKAAALQVYNMQGDAVKAANAINGNQSLSPEAKAKALLDIRVATENAIGNTIGQRGLKYYRNNGGTWLNNISPPGAVPSK